MPMSQKANASLSRLSTEPQILKNPKGVIHQYNNKQILPHTSTKVFVNSDAIPIFIG